MSNTTKKAKFKPVVQDAQFSEEDIQALKLDKDIGGDEDGGEMEIGITRPMAIHDGIVMDPSGSISLAGGRDFGDDYSNRYYYD